MESVATKSKSAEDGHTVSFGGDLGIKQRGNYAGNYQ